MKKCTISILAVLALALFSVTGASAQTTVLVGAGSSALWPSIALSAVAGDPVTHVPALCGTNLWTGGSGAASSITVAQDNRIVGGNSVPPEPGTLWVAWDSDTAPTKICADISVDSVVGDRLFLEQGSGLLGNASLVISPNAKWTVPGNKVAFAQDNTSCAASGGALVFNVDIAEASGTTATVTVHGGGNFSNYFANGATIAIAGSTISGFNATGYAAKTVTQLGPTSFQITTTGTGLGTDAGGTATATVTANCPGIPAAVYTALNNQHITVAFTDVRPEDGSYAEVRASTTLDPTDSSTTYMGYGNRAIKSAFSQALAYPFAFQVVPGQPDPYSGTALPSYVTQGIGAEPVMIIGNTQDTTACGLSTLNNVTWQALANVYTGNSEGATLDLDPSLTGCTVAMPVVEREPLSGTYNTFEWQIVRARSGNNGRSQEHGNVGYINSNNNLGSCAAWTTTLPASAASNPVFPPAFYSPSGTNCGNPLNIQQGAYPAGAPQSGGYGGFGGNRVRAIGTGEMVAAINSTDASAKNALGYAFWSVGTYGKKTGLKYFTLDGSDPLWPSYSANPYLPGTLSLTTGGSPCVGFVNLGTFSCPAGQPTFDGLKNGSYRTFSILRAVYAGTAPQGCTTPTALTIGCLIQAAQDQAANNVHDFLPVQSCANAACTTVTQNLNFFRSHYNVSGVNGHDGNQPSSGGCVGLVPLEAGGDMAGAIFPIQTDFTLQGQVTCSDENTGFIQ
ncbi:MAG TPA: hypothetical protein VJX70_09080 [Candidatus Acidoferrum sp.]|nr:hypothetical protein [Candidatus Acidoferrum sp.]